MMRALLPFLTGLLALIWTGAGAGTLVPLVDNPGGQSASTSAKQWAQWALSFNRVTDGGDPLNDKTGKFQNKKQTFPVFHLGGGFFLNPEPTRTFTARAGKPFMVPLLNNFCVGGSPTLSTCKGQNEVEALDFLDDARKLFLSIDGKTMVNANSKNAVDKIESKLFVDSGIFSVDIAPNNLFTPFTKLVTEGTYSELFNKGFFVFANLPIGQHSVVFGGASQDLSTIVTAKINVVPLPPPLLLLAAGLLGLGLAARKKPVRT